MNKILIGRNGNQPFAIKAEGVSAVHASLTVTDCGVWMLKDEGSTNGTFVRNADGHFERIEVKRISPSTVVRLGDETVNGISFHASRLLKTAPNDYSEEFRRLKGLYAEYIKSREKIRKRAMMRKFIPLVMSVICIIVSIPFDSPQIMRLLMVIPSLATPLINVSDTKDMERQTDRYKPLLVCPKCGKPLGEYEIAKGQCAGCKAHC